jgi:hypothetical protein
MRVFSDPSRLTASLPELTCCVPNIPHKKGNSQMRVLLHRVSIQ